MKLTYSRMALSCGSASGTDRVVVDRRPKPHWRSRYLTMIVAHRSIAGNGRRSWVHRLNGLLLVQDGCSRQRQVHEWPRVYSAWKAEDCGLHSNRLCMKSAGGRRLRLGAENSVWHCSGCGRCAAARPHPSRPPRSEGPARSPGRSFGVRRRSGGRRATGTGDAPGPAGN